MRSRWPQRLCLAAAALVLGLSPLSGDRFWIQFLDKAMVSALFAMSLDLLVGYTGLVSLAHAAFFGLSGYVLAGLTNGLGVTHLLATLPLCLAAAALAALAIGALSLRTAGVYFIMVTLAFTQMLYFLFNDAPGLGGSDGLYVSERPRLTLLGTTVLDLGDRAVRYYTTLAILAAAWFLLRRLVGSPFGRVIAGIRANEPRMQALGFATGRYKLASFVIAGVLAGLAGYLDAALYGFVNPAHLSWRESGLVLVAVLLGGKGTFHGPALGAFLLHFLQTYGEKVTDRWLALIGFIAMGVVLFLPGGLAGLPERLRAPRRARGSAARD
jgi:branched-chain amino acid transport system permease protein